MFLFIGADPNTGWLDDCGVAVDDNGFILTGHDALARHDHNNDQSGDRSPERGRDRPVASLETSVPGVFAIGDVRADSTKRVAAAVGEGAAVVSQIHGFLARLQEKS